jgi:hypothetical protein
MVARNELGGVDVRDEEAQPDQGAGEPAVQDDAAAVVMDLLAEHVPLTLLADLAVAEPRSDVILESEGLPADAWWEDDSSAGPEPRAEDDVPADPDAAGGPEVGSDSRSGRGRC